MSRSKLRIEHADESSRLELVRIENGGLSITVKDYSGSIDQPAQYASICLTRDECVQLEMWFLREINDD